MSLIIFEIYAILVRAVGDMDETSLISPDSDCTFTLVNPVLPSSTLQKEPGPANPGIVPSRVSAVSEFFESFSGDKNATS
ncbi:MAG: hypothetical protein A4E27_00667 [Methanobacterium sp. PtaU1.Bin242]|nr:MAG: hypothetical protein A4E27_00667 [Methanobacterium sp. PtaU1.Bin242]